MVGMSKKRKFGSPASKSIGNEEKECGASKVIREDGSRKETERQVDSRDTLAQALLATVLTGTEEGQVQGLDSAPVLRTR